MNKGRDIMSLLNENYILEAEPRGNIKSKHKRFRISAAAAAAAACLTLTAVSAGAVVIYNMNSSTENYYDSRAVDQIESNGLMLNDTLSNGHFRVTVNTVLADDYSYKIFMTASPLDAEARAFIEDNRPKSLTDADTSDDYPKIEMSVNNSKGDRIGGYGMPARIFPGSESISLVMLGNFDRNFTSNVSDRKLHLVLSSSDTANRRLFEGIEFTVNVTKNLESRSSAYRDGVRISVSPIGYSIILDDYNRRDRETILGSVIRLKWKDGGFERFLNSIEVDPDIYNKELEQNSYAEAFYLLYGKYYKSNKYEGYGIGGGGTGFWTDDPVTVSSDGQLQGEGKYVLTVPFGTLIDLNDIEGVIINKGEEIMFDS